MLDRVPPVSLVLCGVVSVQFGAALATTLFDDLGPAGTSLLRIGFAALIMAAVFRPAVRGLRGADARLVAAFGVTLGVMNLTFYEALDRIPLGVAVTIEFAGPLAVAVIGSRRPLDLLWTALAAAGIVLLANPGGAESLDTLGLVFALSAAVCWGLYIVLAARAGPRFRGSDGVTIAMVIAAVVPIVPGVAEAGDELLQPHLLAIGAAVGLLSSAIPYALETEALRRLPRNVFSVLMSLEPAVAALAGWLVVGQSLAARQLVAIGLVVAASAGASRDAAPPVDA
ncbi:MAG TPA: DMT family transporter [Capillimicrobium sp.]|nr:DMT family transporter [Capillimicrobium sp.]